MTNQQAINILKGLEQSLDDYCELNDEGKAAFRMAVTALELFGNSEQLPSAQPEERTKERTEMHACDLIRRQDAIDALIRKMKPHDNGDGTMTIYVMSERLVKETLNDLPVAQPERCEDCENFNKTQFLIPQPEQTERIYKRGYADGYHKAEKDYFERTEKDRDDAFIAGIETEKEVVRKWLLAYHGMSFDLKGRYLPHEVISWLVNDISKKLFDEGGQK